VPSCGDADECRRGLDRSRGGQRHRRQHLLQLPDPEPDAGSEDGSRDEAVLAWDSLEFQEAFHAVYWAGFHDLESALATTGGRRHVFSYLFYFYDQVGALLRRNLIEYDLVDDLLGNSTRQLWEKVGPVIAEARARSDDPRLYEHFEYLYDEMTRRAEREPRR
jgi:hypothetical protein